MGLDMNLYGEKGVSSTFDKNPVMEDGFILSNKTLEMAYWRKHANLHGFIVKTFAEDNDDCQRIYLDREDLHNIIVALENDAIYDEPVNGFFFGRSSFPGDEYYEQQKAKDLDVFRRALKWVESARPASGDYNSENYQWPEFRSVYYQASW